MSLTDKSPMPFGKYKGIAMANVPAEYLLWLYYNDKAYRRDKDVSEYIEDNIDVLRSEAKSQGNDQFNRE